MVKKILTFCLVVCILLATSVPVFAETSAVMASEAIDKLKVESILNNYVEDGLITQEYAGQVMSIVNQYLDDNLKSEDDRISTNYYDPETGAIIVIIPTMVNHGQLMFNQAGWSIIQSIVNLGGGVTTIGFAISAICGTPVAAPVAALIGGAIVVANAYVALQFALGNEFAFLAY